MRWLTIGDSDEIRGIKEIKGFECSSMSMRSAYEVTMDPLPFDVVYGTLGTVNRIYRYNTIPGNWLDLPNMRCQIYYTYWGRYLLNENYVFYTLGEVYRKSEDLENSFFMRPDSNFKPWPAMIYDKREIELLRKNYDFEPLTSLCVIAPIQKVDKEYRLFMRRGKFISGSLYADKDGPIQENIDDRQDLIAYAESIPQYDGLPAMYALDLTETEEGIKLVELTCFNAAGWYLSDYEKLIHAAELEVSTGG